MTTGPKSTNDIRMIAQEVAHQQEEVCEARRDNLNEKLVDLTDTVRSNAKAISDLTNTVTVLATTIKTLPEDVKANQTAISRLQGRPATWAAIGAALPTLLGVLLWWFSR